MCLHITFLTPSSEKDIHTLRFDFTDGESNKPLRCLTDFYAIDGDHNFRTIQEIRLIPIHIGVNFYGKLVHQNHGNNYGPGSKKKRHKRNEDFINIQTTAARQFSYDYSDTNRGIWIETKFAWYKLCQPQEDYIQYFQEDQVKSEVWIEIWNLAQKYVFNVRELTSALAQQKLPANVFGQMEKFNDFLVERVKEESVNDKDYLEILKSPLFRKLMGKTGEDTQPPQRRNDGHISVSSSSAGDESTSPKKATGSKRGREKEHADELEEDRKTKKSKKTASPNIIVPLKKKRGIEVNMDDYSLMPADENSSSGEDDDKDDDFVFREIPQKDQTPKKRVIKKKKKKRKKEKKKKKKKKRKKKKKKKKRKRTKIFASESDGDDLELDDDEEDEKEKRILRFKQSSIPRKKKTSPPGIRSSSASSTPKSPTEKTRRRQLPKIQKKFVPTKKKTFLGQIPRKRGPRKAKKRKGDTEELLEDGVGFDTLLFEDVLNVSVTMKRNVCNKCGLHREFCEYIACNKCRCATCYDCFVMGQYGDFEKVKRGKYFVCLLCDRKDIYRRKKRRTEVTPRYPTVGELEEPGFGEMVKEVEKQEQRVDFEADDDDDDYDPPFVFETESNTYSQRYGGGGGGDDFDDDDDDDY